MKKLLFLFIILSLFGCGEEEPDDVYTYCSGEGCITVECYESWEGDTYYYECYERSAAEEFPEKPGDGQVEWENSDNP